MNIIERFKKSKQSKTNLLKFQPGGKVQGEFYTDDQGIVRRHNSDGTNTEVTKNLAGNYTWTQPDGRKVYQNNIYTLDNNVYYNIPDDGLQLVINNEGMGPKGYKGYWYKRQKNGKGEKAGWDGWFIGNGLSKSSYPDLMKEFGNPDSLNGFNIKDHKINGQRYQIAIPKQEKYQSMTEEDLARFMRSNKNTDMHNLKNANPELFRLISYAPPFVQEALYSLYHQYGSYVTDPKHEKYHSNDTPKIIEALRNKDYMKLSEIIRNYDKTYKTRRNREAKHITDNLSNSK